MKTVKRSYKAADPALSVTHFGNDMVHVAYDRLASVYDYAFGITLHPGRLRALEKMKIEAGTEILEVGVGTGYGVTLYPESCHVTGIDLSPSMLKKAHERVKKKSLKNVKLFEMDASRLEFSNDQFDIVYAPYVMSVVPDPIQVAHEMWRVCRPGGEVVFLNHFRSENMIFSRFDKLISPLTIHVGFKADLDLSTFLLQTGLKPKWVEKVNYPPIWTLVICEK